MLPDLMQKGIYLSYTLDTILATTQSLGPEMEIPKVGLIGLVLLYPALVSSQTTDDAQTEPAVEIFTSPRAIKRNAPRYPLAQQRKGREGWVNVIYMVDPKGRPYEVVVTSSTGNKAFESAAIRAVKRWSFEPALMNGVPVDAGQVTRVKFQMSRTGRRGARTSFVRAYRKLIKLIADGDRERADVELAKLDIENLYEDAYFNLARYNYYARWGDDDQQLSSIGRAVSHEDNVRYLPDDVFAAALLSKFGLELTTQAFAQALLTWETIKAQNINKEDLAAFQIAIDRILVLKEDDRAYSVPGQIGSNTRWFYRLLKNRFQIDVATGEIAEIKLRCDKNYFFFSYEPEIQYRISDTDGFCWIELVGNPGTIFKLIQS